MQSGLQSSGGSEQATYLHAAPLREALSSLQEGQHSLSLYIDQMCRRIAHVNPQIEAILDEPERSLRLRAEAAALRDHYADPFHRPPLYGALVGIKDIFHVDGFVTLAGSALPPELFAGPEAEVVLQLRNAGALVVGKTVTTEFAYFEPGPTRNPAAPTHTPGGSSSGSAAAVAAGLCTLALGTQTIGSVIRPAAYCGIVGFKPTYDRIPTQGIVYFSRTADHVGLFTQDVAGMAVAAGVLCRDWRTSTPNARLPALGVPDGPYLMQTDPAALAKFEEQVLMLQVAGYTVERVPILDDIANLNHLHRRMIFAEFAQEHAAWFTEHEAKYLPRTVQALRTGFTVSAEELAAVRSNVTQLRQALMAAMDVTNIDLWICPAATGPAPVGLAATGDPNMSLPWTHAGLPVVALPAGKTESGLPLGVQLVARFGADEDLLAWAEALVPHLVDAPDE